MEPDQFFRAGVGAIIVDKRGLVLAAERSDIPSVWQAPQGGLEHGETPVESIHREMAEELGIATADTEILSELRDWLPYELPPESWSTKTGRGQVHRWFLVRLIGKLGPIPIGSEFARHEWVTMASLVDEVWAVRRPVYEKLADVWAPYFAHDV
jgi:putative (di)nucleoside polyphosphate hydrolase